MRSPAAESPAGPLPTMATHLPVGGAIAGRPSWPLVRSWSAMNRSRLPMATGWLFLPNTQLPSHWFSCGQTRPVMAGSGLSSRIFGRPGAGEAARGFFLGALRAEALVHLGEAVRPHLWLKFRHGHARNLYPLFEGKRIGVRHSASPLAHRALRATVPFLFPS